MTVTLSPGAWPALDVQRWLALSAKERPGNPPARGTHGAVTSAHGAFASYAALQALRQGGTSVDAVLTGALAQIVLTAGAPVSLFGILGMVHFDAASGRTYTLNAGWRTCREERDPLTIPGGIRMGDNVADMLGTAVSGRTALVGGFMRGFDAAHRRFGKLPYAALFEPARWLASEGFEVTKALDRYVSLRQDDLNRLEATRAVFTRPGGGMYRAGDRFRQPALATTLAALAEHGSDYFYRGAWAQKCVAAVRADGGRMTAQDLAGYEPLWSDPIEFQVRDATLSLTGEPCMGSTALAEALHLAQAAGLRELGHWSKNAESFRRLVDVTNVFGLAYLPPATVAQIFPGVDRSDAARRRPETAAALWKAMQSGMRLTPPLPRGTHSDNLVAVDAFGNMTAICQSINSVIWGKTAIMVDGVSIGDPASFQQAQIAQAGPGNPLPMPVEAGILRHGRRRVAFTSMNAGLHHKTTQCLLNLLDFGMSLPQAVDAPALLLPEFLTPRNASRVRVAEGEFDPALLEQTGLEIGVLPPDKARFAEGLWVAIERDDDNGALQAVSPASTNGQAAAY